MMRTERLLRDCIAIVEEAGHRIALPAFRESIVAKAKPDGSVVTKTDRDCQRFIAERLARLDGAIAFLGEEMAAAEQQARLDRGGRCWCLDPLDGTSNFVAGLPLFAISLALIEDGRPVLACIHDPVRGETFHAMAGGGARLSDAGGDTSIRTRGPERLKEAVGFLDFKRLERSLAAGLAAGQPARSLRNLGSCALEWAWLAAGRGAFIVHGGEKIWDFAAGALLAVEAGAVVTDFAARPLLAEALPAASPILAATPAIHPQIHAALGG
ncbi:MAG: inositol monophosphatase family protein [Mariprofundaceae bacterium]